MNERLQELLDSVQRTACQVSDAAADAAYGVGKKAGALLSVAKLNIQVMDLKAEVNTQLRTVGEMIYGTHTGTPTDSDVLLAKMQEIDSLKARLRELEGDPVIHLLCPRCGREVRPDDVYCRDCGEKL